MENLSRDEQIKSLDILFDDWIGTADHDSESERLGNINLNDFDKNLSIIKEDLISKIPERNINLVKSVLNMIIAGNNDQTLCRHFQSRLIASSCPKDEIEFARKTLELISENFR